MNRSTAPSSRVTTLHAMRGIEVDHLRNEAIIRCVPDPRRSGRYNVTVSLDYPLHCMPQRRRRRKAA